MTAAMLATCALYLGAVLAAISPFRAAVARVVTHNQSVTEQVSPLLPFIAAILIAEGLATFVESRVGSAVGSAAPRVPLVILPFGRTIRWIVIELASILVVVPKLTIYFVSIALIDPITLIVRPLAALRDRHLPPRVAHATAILVYLTPPLVAATITVGLLWGVDAPALPTLLALSAVGAVANILLALFVDDFDDVAEGVEGWLVSLYNAVYFLPLPPNEDGLGVWFNRYAWLWCVNH